MQLDFERAYQNSELFLTHGQTALNTDLQELNMVLLVKKPKFTNRAMIWNSQVPNSPEDLELKLVMFVHPLVVHVYQVRKY